MHKLDLPEVLILAQRHKRLDLLDTVGVRNAHHGSDLDVEVFADHFSIYVGDTLKPLTMMISFFAVHDVPPPPSSSEVRVTDHADSTPLGEGYLEMTGY